MTSTAEKATAKTFFLSIECEGPDENGIVPVPQVIFEAVRAAAQENGNKPVVDHFDADGLGYPDFDVLRIRVA